MRPADIQAVLFDVGGIFVTRRLDAGRFLDILGLDPTNPFDRECLDKAMWSHRDKHDLGLSDAEFWATVAMDIGVDSPRADTLQALIRADVSRMHDAEPSALEIVDLVLDAGLTVGLLANAPASVGQEIKATPWAASRFTHYTFSSDLHVRKPHSSIYNAAASDLQLTPEQILFIDDRDKHVRGAQYVGMDAFTWHDAHQVRRELVARGILAQAAIA